MPLSHWDGTRIAVDEPGQFCLSAFFRGNRSVGHGFFTAEVAEDAEMSKFSDFCGVR
jgi:hypothetical protein